MRKKTQFCLLFLVALFLLVFLSEIRMQVDATVESNYVVDGDLVYIDDENAYIAVYPHTVNQSQYVYLNVTSKRYEGQVDFCFGFDSDTSKPRSLEVYSPFNVTTQHQENLSTYFENQTRYKVDYNYTTKEGSIAYDGYIWLYANMSIKDENNVTIGWEWWEFYSQDFDEANWNTKTIYWATTRTYLWRNIRDRFQFDVYHRDFKGMTKWFASNHSVTEDKQYHLRFWLEVLPKLEQQHYKYFVAFKPQTETLQEAIANGHFYYLDPWYNSNWQYRKKLTIDSGDIDSNLTDFPVLVYLNSSRIDWSHVQDDLDDLRFTSDDAQTLLKYEIENYTVNDEAWLWVKVSDVSSSVDTDFYIYYDNAGASNGEDIANVWDSNFVMVQHLNETGGDGSTRFDSTVEDSDFTMHDISVPNATGKVDGCDDFESSNTDYADRGDDATLDLDNYTIEFWLRPEWFVITGIVTEKREGAENDRHLNWKFSQETSMVLSFYHGDGATGVTTQLQTGLDWNTWSHIVGVYDAANDDLILYENGTAVDWDLDETMDPYTGGVQTTKLGRGASDNSYYLDGKVDEFRISNIARSASWIKATYETTRDDFITFGNEEEKGVPFNDNVSLSDPDVGTQGVLAQKKAYTFFAGVSDTDGWTDIKNITLVSDHSIEIQYDNATDTFTEVDLNGYIVLNGSSSSSRSGDWIILTVLITFDWDFPDESLHEWNMTTYDSAGASDTDSYADVYYVENDLTPTPFACDDDRGDINQLLTFNGTLLYEGTAISPPDVQITQLQIHNSSHSAKGTGTTTSGFFSIGVTAESTVQNTTYHVYVNGSGDYSDGDLAGNVSFVSDSLEVYNLQTVEYLDDGSFKYEAQVKYSFDSATINGASVNISLPSGASIGQDTSNTTGWITFVLSQANATESGNYTIFGVNDNNYTVTVAAANQTVTLRSWTLNSFDNDGNSLSNQTIAITEPVAVWSGIDRTLRIPEDTFNVTVTWLESLQVNSTTNITISGDTTTNFTCLCYPYTVSGTNYWVASNATISSTDWSNSIMTVHFSDSVDTYILVASYTTKPAYVLNCTYDYDTDFSTYLVLTHYANTTISLSHESWSNTRIKRLTDRLVSVSLSEQKLRMYVNNTASDTGTLEIYCGSRGRPQTEFGFTASSYANQTFTGTIQFASQVYCWVDWTTELGGEPQGGDEKPVSLLVVNFPLQLFTVSIGQPTNLTLNFTFDRSNLIFIEEIKFSSDYTEWFSVKDGLPIRVLKTAEGEQTVAVELVVLVPKGTSTGPYKLPCTLLIRDGAVIHTINSFLQFNLATSPTVPDYMALIFLAFLGVFFVGTLSLKFRKRS